jgi:hypothetical protein
VSAIILAAIVTFLVAVAVFRRAAFRSHGVHPADVLAGGCSALMLIAVGAFILFFLACAATM